MFGLFLKAWTSRLLCADQYIQAPQRGIRLEVLALGLSIGGIRRNYFSLII